jgi:hypothetical protein
LQARVLILIARGIKWRRKIERVGEHLPGIVIDVCPHGHCLLLQVVLVSLSLRVAQESPESACVDLISYKTQHFCVELEHGRHLNVNHPNEVQKLNKYRGALIIIIIFIVVAESACEHVAEGEPVFFNECLKASKGSVTTVKHKLGKGGQLGSSIPTIRTVDQDVLAVSQQTL